MTTRTHSDTRKTKIWSTIDLDAEGRSLGYLRLTVSTHERDAAALPIPVAVFKNGTGPRILLLGGVHGDEFEGQFMAMKLIRSLDIDNVQGHIIVLPAANAPAAVAGLRTSPLDGGDLNRSYPGDPEGTPTEQIAFFIDSVLLPKVDYLLDFHSGGNAFRTVPSAHVYYSEDKAKMDRLVRMLEVFGMPYSAILQCLSDHGRKSIGSCDRLGVLRFSSELGGGGGMTPAALRQAETGLARLLFEIGALKSPMTDEPPPPTKFIRRLPQRHYIYAPASGHFERYVETGEEVKKGRAGGAIYFPEEPWREPVEVRFEEDGAVYCIRTLSRTLNGDLLFMLHVPWPGQ